MRCDNEFCYSQVNGICTENQRPSIVCRIVKHFPEGGASEGSDGSNALLGGNAADTKQKE